MDGTERDPAYLQPKLNTATNLLECTGPSWTKNVVFNPALVLTDIQANALPAVSWVMPKGGSSDHAGPDDRGLGSSWVASIINAVGNNSRYWANTVILITWDDWGGWYDHVLPPTDPTYGYYEYGFRVPLLVVSAYTPAGYVSNRTHAFGSILHFVESVFGLPFIPPGTYDDARSDDLLDFFNFNARPRAFTPIAAPVSARYFINDKRPAMDDD